MFKNETLAKKIEERKALKDQIDVLEFKLKNLETELKEDMKERESEVYEFEFDGSKHKITCKTVVQNRFDSTRFKEECPDIYNSFTKEVVINKLTCK